MKASFEGRVHSAAERSFDRPAKLDDGREVMAPVPGMTVEIVSEHHGHTIHLESMSKEHMDEMKAAAVAGKRARVHVELLDDDDE